MYGVVRGEEKYGSDFFYKEFGNGKNMRPLSYYHEKSMEVCSRKCRCVTTGIEYRSINEAARMNKISSSSVKKSIDTGVDVRNREGKVFRFDAIEQKEELNETIL